ncbi:MAG TPA: YicC family protein [Bacteroidales bacterium]|nr:YicC family protein [Bacteroidales bacterium]
MTGYGKAVAELPNKKVTIEIKSLNSKQFDLYTRIPVIYRVKEIELRNSLSHLLERGKVDLTINVEQFAKDISSRIDYNVLNQYKTDIEQWANDMGISVPDDWFSVLLRLPDVMKQETEELDEEEWNIIKDTINKAVESLILFREQEGKMLENVLIEKISNIRSLLVDIATFEGERIERVKNRILEELNNLGGIEYDKNRFEQEIIYYLEKLDINEEKTRLSHHLNYFEEILKENKSQGKKLGFITQEIGREINTLGSKSNQSGMQRIVVQMKDELEQIKEQVLNIL